MLTCRGQVAILENVFSIFVPSSRWFTRRPYDNSVATIGRELQQFWCAHPRAVGFANLEREFSGARFYEGFIVLPRAPAIVIAPKKGPYILVCYSKAPLSQDRQ